MNIMKTNMLSLNNKFLKEDSGNTTQAPVPSTTEPQEGMKALSFLGMKNLMANPKLAQEVGVMSNTAAPYSSNIAFQGKFGNVAEKAGRKFAQMAPAGLVAMSTLIPAMALTSCDKELKATQEQTVIVDVSAVVAAIEALRAEIKANDQAETARQKEMLETLNNALNVLYQIHSAVKNQTLTIEEFKELVLGKMENGELQRSAILEAIMELQDITEAAAVSTVNAILLSYQNGQISFNDAMAKIQNLLKENNNLLKDVLAQLKATDAKVDQYANALLKVANEINKNGKASIEQQNYMIAQNEALIEQNNIQISQLDELIEKANELSMSVDELTVIAQILGKSITDVMNMSKNEIIAAIKSQVVELKLDNEQLDTINNNIKNNTISAEEAAKQIIAILGGISSDVSEIKSMLKDHFAKYDNDMAELKALMKDKNADVKKIAAYAAQISADIKNLSADIKEIKNDIKNGVKYDDSQIQELLKKINATQDMTKEQIIAKMDTYIKNQEGMADKLDETNNLLTKLGFVVSNDVINAINNLGDDLSGLDAINTKLDELIAAVKSFAKSFDLYAKYAAQAHDDEMEALNNIKDNVKNIGKDTQEMIKEQKKAEVQRNTIISYLESLQGKADKIIEKMGRIPTIEEFDVMLTAHDEDNQKFYGDLIKAAQVDPAQFENIKDLLKTINENLVDFQGTSNGYLADILARIKAMDPTATDYTAKLNKIIELMEGFKFECNCKCDCDNNKAVDEGIIDIIG